MPITIQGGTGFDRGGRTTIDRSFQSVVENAALPAVQAGTGRRAGDCLRMNYFCELVAAFPEDDEFLIAIAYRPVDVPPAEEVILISRAGNTHVSVATAADGRLVIKRGTTTVLATSAQALTTGQWNQFQVYVKIDDSAGEARLYWNGSSTPDANVDLSGINTQGYVGLGEADAVVDGFTIGGGVRAETFEIDDLAWGNGGNTLIGDVALTADAPTGDGSHEDFAKTSGVDMWALIDEDPPDVDDSDYIFASTGKATLTYPVLPFNPGSVIAVIQKVMVRRDDGIARKIGDFLDDGSEWTGTRFASISSEYLSVDLIRQEINAAPLTKTNIDAAEWGIEITLD